MKMRFSLLFAATFSLNLLSVCLAKTVFHEFHVAYISGTPDGVLKPKILTVNGLFPGPTIEAEVGDTVHVVVYNEIQDGQNVSMHWHGMHHRENSFEDGSAHVTQCPLKHGEFQTYVFKVDLPGTYWYHSHVKSQYTEGLWGLLIVQNTPEYYKYDGEITLALSDWYHRSAYENEYWYESTLAHGNPPYPDSALINGMGRYSCDFALKRSFLQNCSAADQYRNIYRVNPNKIYRIRVLNTAANAMFRLSIDSHKLQAIEVDGVDVIEPVEVDEVIIAQGQRYSFLVKMNAAADEYLIRADIMTEMLQLLPRENLTPYPEAILPNATVVLKYRESEADYKLPDVGIEVFDYTKEVPPKEDMDRILLDERYLLPADGIRAPENFDNQVILEVAFEYDPRGLRRATFNRTWWALPDFPVMMSVMEDLPVTDTVNPITVHYGQVVEIVINNAFYGPHPFHLHGHHFWVMGKGEPVDGNYDPERHQLSFDGVRRDTFIVEERSWGVLRFVADNPGVWNFHCHNDWHNLSGMAAVIIEAPEVIRQNFTYPAEVIRVCQLQGIDLPVG